MKCDHLISGTVPWGSHFQPICQNLKTLSAWYPVPCDQLETNNKTRSQSLNATLSVQIFQLRLTWDRMSPVPVPVSHSHLLVESHTCVYPYPITHCPSKFYFQLCHSCHILAMNFQSSVAITKELKEEVSKPCTTWHNTLHYDCHTSLLCVQWKSHHSPHEIVPTCFFPCCSFSCHGRPNSQLHKITSLNLLSYCPLQTSISVFWKHRLLNNFHLYSHANETLFKKK